MFNYFAEEKIPDFLYLKVRFEDGEGLFDKPMMMMAMMGGFGGNQQSQDGNPMANMMSMLMMSKMMK